MRRVAMVSLAVVVGVAAVGIGGWDRASRAEDAAPMPVYVFAGQSNMVGYESSSTELATIDHDLLVPSASTWMWGPTDDAAAAWAPMGPATETAQSGGKLAFGPELTAARRLAQIDGQPVGVVKLAVTGSNLHTDWNPDTAGGLYSQLVARVRAALAALPTTAGRRGRLAGFFWMQGESDVATFDQASAYYGNLTRFIARLRADLDAPRLAVVQGQIGAGGWGRPDIVRAAQLDVARDVLGVAWVPTDDLERSAFTPAHFTARSTVELGYRFAQALGTASFERPAAEGAKPASATRPRKPARRPRKAKASPSRRSHSRRAHGSAPTRSRHHARYG